MKRCNQKGFSLLELLGVVAILGILSVITISAYTKYKDKARNQAYDTLAQSAMDAAEEYLMDNPYETEVNFDTLVLQDYLENTSDPGGSEKKCVGTVRIAETDQTDETKLKETSFVVDMCCANNNYEYESNGRKVKTTMCHAEFNSEEYIEHNAETNCQSDNLNIKSFSIYTMDYMDKVCTKTSDKYGTCSDSVANQPCRKYDYHQYDCNCQYSKTTKKYCSSNISSSSSHTMRIRYYDNANGINACNSDEAGSFNSYVSQVCTYGTYGEGKDVMTFHGYQFFKGKSVGYTDFRPEGTWFHDPIAGVTLEDRVQRKDNSDGSIDPEQGCRDTCIRFTEAINGKIS